MSPCPGRLGHRRSPPAGLGHAPRRGWGAILLSLAACGGGPPTDAPPIIAPPGKRSTVDRPAEETGSQIHLIYMIPSDGLDVGYDTTGAIAGSVGHFQYWLIGKTGLMLRQDMYQHRLDISFMKSKRSDRENAAYGTQMLSRLYAEVRGAGFDEADTKYLIYYDGTNRLACGEAIQGGPAAVLYLKGSVDGHSCGDGFSLGHGPRPGFWEFAMLHEVIHTLGMVDDGAPNHYAGSPWHVQDDADLMHGGGGLWTPSLLDRDNDDYYGVAVPSGVRNLMNDPILVPVPQSTAALAKAQMAPPPPLPPFIHHVIQFP